MRLIFWLMFPSLVSRSVLHLKASGEKTLVSVAFIATFEGGVIKSLCHKPKWYRTCDLIGFGLPKGEEFLPKDYTPLYYRDWTNNPTRGSFTNNYPA